MPKPELMLFEGDSLKQPHQPPQFSPEVIQLTDQLVDMGLEDHASKVLDIVDELQNRLRYYQYLSGHREDAGTTTPPTIA